MCDYSLHNVKSRPAKVGDKLTTRNFNTGTRGFAAPEDTSTAVCVLPGTELAFAAEVKCGGLRSSVDFSLARYGRPPSIGRPTYFYFEVIPRRIHAAVSISRCRIFWN
jgi:hypothetical protein